MRKPKQNCKKMKPIKIPPINENWRTIKFISGRVATKSDVENGSAVFYIENAKQHIAENINLPTLAYLCDFEEENDDYWEVVIVIQNESYYYEEYSEYVEFVGYRKFNGEAHVCRPNDLKFLRDYQIERFK